MFEYIQGTLTDKEIAQIVVEAHGVGYAVVIPLSTYEKLPNIGQEVKIFIHYYLREDDLKLYGFASKDEREIFRHLLTVNTVGPKVAVNIMSGVSIDNLILYVNTANTAALRKTPGVGPKMAERIVIELRDKLKKYSTASAAILSSTMKINGGRKEEAYAAMLSLGYNDKQVSKAIDRVAQEISKDALVEKWIRMALQVI